MSHAVTIGLYVIAFALGAAALIIDISPACSMVFFVAAFVSAAVEDAAPWE